MDAPKCKNKLYSVRASAKIPEPCKLGKYFCFHLDDCFCGKALVGQDTNYLSFITAIDVLVSGRAKF